MIYENREAIATILDRNALFNDIRLGYDNILKTIEAWYDPDAPQTVFTDLFDTAPANTFQFRSEGAGVMFTGLTEKDVWDIRQILN